MSTLWAVVLAGGALRRFGSDKLEAKLGYVGEPELIHRDNLVLL